MFTGQAADWGFTEFLRLEDALNSGSGFVVNDTLIIRIAINVQKRDNMHTISRKQTGFAGLKNQGSTGYLNAVLQYLYHIPYLRRVTPSNRWPRRIICVFRRCIKCQHLKWMKQGAASQLHSRACSIKSYCPSWDAYQSILACSSSTKTRMSALDTLPIPLDGERKRCCCNMTFKKCWLCFVAILTRT